jgi:hypothetical protein
MQQTTGMGAAYERKKAAARQQWSQSEEGRKGAGKGLSNKEKSDE